ncbi:hypothetical protein A0H76_2089 [Hepatospora eriocheir]|uniref:Uncharacterized protein n=1 Tax=Hepatospora eriocheir TaxID=1081669 RepID=A0A1X0QG79_9MICR|nr:hypothetical protein A0H76_2089 [Hepatospora eriocheir]
MTLSLPIPENTIKILKAFNSFEYLSIKEGTRFADIKKYLNTTDDLLICEYLNNYMVNIYKANVFEGGCSIFKKKNSTIVAYKYSPNKKHLLLKIFYKKYYLIYTKSQFDVLINIDDIDHDPYKLLHENRVIILSRVYKELKNILINITLAEFLELSKLEGSISVTDRDILTINLKISSYIFKNIRNENNLHLNDCLNNFLATESIEYTCENSCKSLANVSYELMKLPKYLIIFL